MRSRLLVAVLAFLALLPAGAQAARPITGSSRLSLSGLGGIGIGERLGVVRARIG